MPARNELEAARKELAERDRAIVVFAKRENQLSTEMGRLRERIAELEDQTANENYCVNYCGVNEQLRKRIAELERDVDYYRDKQ